jgi:WD40 repeat protein
MLFGLADRRNSGTLRLRHLNYTTLTLTHARTEARKLPPTTQRRAFVAHRGEVTALAYNSRCVCVCSCTAYSRYGVRSGSMFASASGDKTVKLWESRTAALKGTLEGASQTVRTWHDACARVLTVCVQVMSVVFR